jgi:hypothetical protein
MKAGGGVGKVSEICALLLEIMCEDYNKIRGKNLGIGLPDLHTT